MNVFMLLIPKVDCCVLRDTDTLRQGLEKMRYHGYTALPVITRDGKLAGCVNEGDFLWHLLQHGGDMRAQEQYLVRDILRADLNPAVKSTVTMDELLERATTQNFIPVVDDRDCLCGIITRRRIMRAMLVERSFVPPAIPTGQTTYIN